MNMPIQQLHVVMNRKVAERKKKGTGSTAKQISSTVVSDHKIDICFGRHCRDASPRQTTLTMTELAARFSTPDTKRGKLTLAEYLALDKKIKEQKNKRNAEKDGEYFITAAFTRSGTRSAKDVRAITAFVGDIDTGSIDEEQLKAILKGSQYVAYSSYSHQSSEPRWRFIVPYARPVTAAEHRKVFAFLQQLFDGHLDVRCETISQLWYTPACPPDAVAQFEFFCEPGDLLDPDQIPDAVPSPPTSPARDTAQGPAVVGSRSLSVSELDRLNSALGSIPADDRSTWINVGLALARDVGGKTGLGLWLEWSKKSVKFDHDDAVAKWEGFDTSDRDGKLTLGTVFHLARSAGWVDTQPKVPDFVAELNRDHFVALDGGKNWVCREDIDPELNRSYLNRMQPAAFQMFYANQKVPVHVGGTVTMRGKAEAWFQEPGRRSYRAISFMPAKPAPLGHYNLWHGFGISPRQGSWARLRRHIVDVVCSGDAACAEYLLNWMAFAVQHPDKPAEVAVVLQGARGTGKGKLASLFAKLFGQHALQITQSSHLTGKFNAHLRTCVFLFVDEALWAGDKAGENVLKGLITESTLTIEGKGQNIITVPNRLHIMMASNNDWVVPAGPQERRFFVLRVGEQRMQDHKYFAAIDKQMLDQGGLEAMMFDLLQRDLTNFNIRQVPRSAGLDEQVLRSLDAEMTWWMDRLGQPFTPAGWQFQPRALLQFGFSEALGRNGYGKGTETRLGMFLRDVVPGGKPKKVAHAALAGHPQPCYEFPPQVTCQNYLMQKLGLSSNPWV